MSATFRTIRCNGLAMRLAEASPPAAPEAAPLVILAHGWPESWYSWRHQMGPLAEAGYRVVAPDMRGYGGTDAPADVAAYDIEHLVADMAGIVEAAGQDRVVRVPALYVAGDRDLAVAHLGRAEVERRMRPLVPDLRHIEWIEGAGHWIQQECPDACNRALLAFLAGL